MPSAPPVRAAAVHVASRPQGGLVQVALATDTPVAGRPGQLVALVDRRREATLPTVSWLAGVGDQGPGLELVVDPADPVTGWVARLAAGDQLDVTLPLGRGFRLPSTGVPALLVTEGRTAGAALWLARALRERGCTTQLLLVGDTVESVPDVVEARRDVDDVVLVTRDGQTSRGVPVAPEDVLRDLLRDSDAPVCYVTAPLDRATLWAFAAEEAGMTTQVALDEPMPCGTGLCGACTLPVVGDDGRTAAVRRCTEGPVLPAGRVAWDVLQEGTW